MTNDGWTIGREDDLSRAGLKVTKLADSPRDSLNNLINDPEVSSQILGPMTSSEEREVIKAIQDAQISHVDIMGEVVPDVSTQNILADLKLDDKFLVERQIEAKRTMSNIIGESLEQNAATKETSPLSTSSSSSTLASPAIPGPNFMSSPASTTDNTKEMLSREQAQVAFQQLLKTSMDVSTSSAGTRNIVWVIKNFIVMFSILVCTAFFDPSTSLRPHIHNVSLLLSMYFIF